MNLNKKETAVLTKRVSSTQAKILKELLLDGRKSEKEITENTGLTKENVKKNYHIMEKMGIITGATTHINYRILDYKAVAYIIISVNRQHADQLIEYLQKMPEVYSIYNRNIKGNLDVVTILKTLEQLNSIKDQIKSCFQVSEMKTVIWTDVKEMNNNLAAISDNRKNSAALISKKVEDKSKLETESVLIIDDIDQKIIEVLSANGRIPISTLANKIGISTGAAKNRYEKLKNNGVLKVTIQINPNKIGYRALCIFFVVISHENPHMIVEKIMKIPDIISIMKTTGDYDLQIWAMVQDIDELLFIQEELGKIQGITKIEIEMSRFNKNIEKWPTPKQYISTF
jgi:DNA-binding Lrp family transcriptional regulator